MKPARAASDPVAERVRTARALAGLTQVELGRRLGISYQQIGKYEAGRNKISALRLCELANALGIPIPFFFESSHEPVAQSGIGRIALLQAYRQLGLANRTLIITIANALVEAENAVVKSNPSSA